MARIVYVNGAYRPHREAGVSIDDRGYQFADAVYEVFAVVDGRPVDTEAHFDRLERSLDAVRIAPPMSRAAFGIVMRELIRRNRVRFGLVYLQIGRGVASRGHAFPADIRPSVVGTARSLAPDAGDALARAGVAVITLPEVRWARRDIKTTALLPNVLARQQAVERGAYEAWFVDDRGVVTEGAATNAWIVDSAGRLITRPLSDSILHGVTRRAVLDLARQANYQVVERGFTVAEACAAREAFLTSATSFVMPIVRVDDTAIGDGAPGPVATALRALYCDRTRSSA
jgi:D-alanine transaminase